LFFSVCFYAEADLGVFNRFSGTGAHEKGPPEARECRTPARHFQACCGAFLWRVAAFKRLFGAARHSLAWRL